jgi:ABC-type Na+ efflux pump permease subunit
VKDFFPLVWHDIKRLYNYRIIHFVVVLTFLFSMTIWFLPQFGSANFLYISIFVLPVIIFSISMFIEREEKTFVPLITSQTDTLKIVAAKILAAVTIEIFPFIGYTIVTLIRSSEFSNSIHINYFFLFLVYLMGVIVHIIIGLSLSIIAKTSRILSLSYLGYIVVFSLLPILYSNGIIPQAFQYYLIISPAYLSGVLVDYIISDALNPEVWLIILSIVLQIVYAVVLIRFVVMPFFKQYLLATTDENNK